MKQAALRTAALLFLIMLILMTAGCWDYVELENRGIVIGIGIDEAEQEEESGATKRTYDVTIQKINPSGIGGTQPMGGSPSGQSGTKSYLNRIVRTQTLSNGVSSLITQSERIPYLSHLQLVLLGEEMVQKGVQDFVDFFSRSPTMRRRTEVMIANGKARDYLEQIAHIGTNPPALYLVNITDNEDHTLQIPISNIGDLTEAIQTGSPIIVPYLKMDRNKTASIAGGAVIQDYQLQGIISSIELGYLSFLRDRIRPAYLQMPCTDPNHNGVFMIHSGDTKFKPSVKGGRPVLDYYIKLKGELIEYPCPGFKLEKQQDLKQIEKFWAKALKEKIDTTYKKVNERYHADLYYWTTRLNNYPKLHQQIIQNPVKFFQSLQLNTHVDLKIVNIGNTQETLPPRRGKTAE